MTQAKATLSAPKALTQPESGRRRVSTHQTPAVLRPRSHTSGASDPVPVDADYEDHNDSLSPGDVAGLTVVLAVMALAIVGGVSLLRPSTAPMIVNVSGGEQSAPPRPSFSADHSDWPTEVTPALNKHVMDMAARSSMPAGVVAASLTTPKTGFAGGSDLPLFRSVGRAKSANGGFVYYEVYTKRVCADERPSCFQVESVDWKAGR